MYLLFRFLVLLVLLLCLNIKENATAYNHASVQAKCDTVQKWTEVGVKAAAAGQNNDLDSAIGLINSIGAALPYAGPLASVISGIMAIFVKSELSQVMDKLQEMSTKLKRLDDRIQDVIKEIGSVQITVIYKSKVEDIHNLNDAYRRFIANPTTMARDDFRRKCGQNKMLEFLKWLERELCRETLVPLRKVMLQDYDMRTFNEWSNRIGSMLSSAVFLHTTCVGASQYNETTIRETLEGINGRNGDTDTMKQVLKNVKIYLNRGRKHIKRSFHDQAKKEVKQAMSDNEWNSNRYFVDQLYAKMIEKYYWRKWMVTAWNGNTKGYHYHAIGSAKNSWYWLRENNKCVFVGTALQNGDQLENQIKNCGTWRRFDGELSIQVYDHFEKCISTPHTLGVVLTGEGLTCTYTTGAFQNQNFNYGTGRLVSVFGIPDDKLDPDNEGELCNGNGKYCYGSTHCCGNDNCCNDSE